MNHSFFDYSQGLRYILFESACKNFKDEKTHGAKMAWASIVFHGGNSMPLKKSNVRDF